MSPFSDETGVPLRWAVSMPRSLCGGSLVLVPLRCGVLCPAALVSRLLTKQQQTSSFVGLVAVVSGEHSRQLAGATESDVVFTDAPRIAAHCCCYYYSEGSRYIFLSLEREEEMSNQCRPRVRVEYPPNLSILISGGKETNRDSLSKGD